MALDQLRGAIKTTKYIVGHSFQSDLDFLAKCNFTLPQGAVVFDIVVSLLYKNTPPKSTEQSYTPILQELTFYVFFFSTLFLADHIIPHPQPIPKPSTYRHTIADPSSPKPLSKLKFNSPNALKISRQLKALQIPFKNLHNAGNDAYYTVAILQRLISNEDFTELIPRPIITGVGLNTKALGKK